MIHTSALQLRHIRAFLAIVESGSIRAAARKVGLSQPALTKTLRELETILAVPLLFRSSSGIALTEYGRALLTRSTIVDRELQRAQDEIAQMLGARQGSVVVGISPLAALLMGRDALTRFWQAYPESDVRLVDGLFDFLVLGVEQGRLDFAIGPLSPSSITTAVVAEPLFEHPILPVVRRNHPLAAARSLAELRAGQWLITSADLSFRDLMTGLFAEHGLEFPRVAVTCESFPATLELVAHTDLIAPLTPILVEHELLRDRLAVVKIREKPPVTVTALLRRTGVPLTPLAEALAQEFRRIAQHYARKAGS